MATAYRRKYRDKAKGRTLRCRTYTIEYQDAGGIWHRQATKYTDKQAAVDLARRLERESAQGVEGRRNLFAQAMAAPLADHFAAYLDNLKTQGRDDMYCYTAGKRLDRLAEECVWRTLADVTADSFMRWRTAAKGERRGSRTLNQYLETARTFLAWCVRPGGRLPGNPLADVEKLDADIRRKRRAFTLDEVRRLLKAAPADRRFVYLFAAYTGLRRAELADLQWCDFRLSAVKPYIQLRAAATKARRADCLPLRQDIAAMLRSLRPADSGPDDRRPVFPKVPSMFLFKADLTAAGIEYKDAQGRQADFHALARMTLSTMLAQGGTAPRVTMEVMRHTDMRLTMNVYTDPGLLATADAVESLPDLSAPPAAAATPTAEAVQATAAIA